MGSIYLTLAIGKNYSMHVLTDKQFQTQVEPILRQVFVKDDPFDNAFSLNISERIIVYPCFVELKKSLMNALIKGASAVDDKGCYLSQLWILEDDRNHCYIPLSELHEFNTVPSEKAKFIDISLNMNSEYVLYSESGKWGLMVSHEDHGILGGVPKFMQKFKNAFPNYNKQVYDWLKSFQEEKKRKAVHGLSPLTLHWLPGLLTHVYGQQASEQLLKETELL